MQHNLIAAESLHYYFRDFILLFISSYIEVICLIVGMLLK